jgi:pyruvate,water dikinase
MMKAVECAVAAVFEEPPAQVEARAVVGLGAAAGVYEGRARLVLGPADFGKLQEGDVLVTRSTSEAFNVVLPLLGAVVTDRGGFCVTRRRWRASTGSRRWSARRRRRA